MKLICSQHELTTGITNASKAAAIRSPMPILDGILFEATDQIKLTGYNMEIGVECMVPAEVQKPGSVVLNVRMFNEIVRKLPEEMISIEMDENETVVIQSGKSVFKIKGREATTFPKLPEVAVDSKLTMKQKSLKTMIRRTIFSVSTDEARRNLNGCLLQCSGNRMIMVAIDGFRLAMCAETSENELPDLEFIIHGKALREVQAILSDGDEDVTIYNTQNHILFNFGDVKLVSRLIQGEYMNYKSIIPTSEQTNIQLNTHELFQSIERAMLIVSAEEQRFPVSLSTVDQTLMVDAVTTNGVLHDEISVDMQGQPIDINFYPRYFYDALRVIDDEQISVSFNGNIGPCLIRPLDSDQFTYLLLPLRK
ncbi:MAG: DNA polymerase III subunit beta [Fastidiosipilaceae bacterium]|jgi:DNA polymerase-3 subunit beta